MAPDSDVLVLQQQVVTLTTQQADLSQRQLRFEDRYDKGMERLFDKLDEQSQAQAKALEELRGDLAPVVEWMNKGKGGVYVLVALGGLAGAALTWLVKQALK